MKTDTFTQLFEAMNKRVYNLLVDKSKEYASDADRLENFHRGASITGKHPASVCWMYDLKHICSIQNIIDKVEAGEQVPPGLIKEKIGDYLAYGYLLYIILREKNNGKDIPSTSD